MSKKKKKSLTIINGVASVVNLLEDATVTTKLYENLELKLGLTKQEALFCEVYNPLVLYCRLIDIGFGKNDALDITKYYEKNFYDPIMDSYKRIDKQ